MSTLKDKFRGCIAGSWVGSSMGAVVEGWPAEKIKATYERLDKLEPYKHYIEYTDWSRPAGTTEDGIERQKLITTAILGKKDRILAQDLAAVWARDLDPAKMIYKQEPYDTALCSLIKAGVPFAELGRMSPFVNVVTMARASHSLGLVNAGDPQGAADDSFEVGSLYVRENAFALRWAALYNAGIAAACQPGATVETVINTVKQYATYRADTSDLATGIKDPRAEKFSYDKTEREVSRAFELAKENPDPDKLRDKFNEIYYGGYYMTYGLSTASEIVSKGLALFALHQGNTKEAIVSAVNFGRDTDCLAAVAGGLCGALTGTSHIPAEWIATVNSATKSDPYTNSRLTIEETADGLYEVFQSRQKKLAEYVQRMSKAE